MAVADSHAKVNAVNGGTVERAKALAQEFELLSRNEGATLDAITKLGPVLLDLPVTSAAIRTLGLSDEGRPMAAREVLVCAARQVDRFGEVDCEIFRTVLGLQNSWRTLTDRENALHENESLGFPASYLARKKVERRLFEDFAVYLVALQEYPCDSTGTPLSMIKAAEAAQAQADRLNGMVRILELVLLRKEDAIPASLIEEFFKLAPGARFSTAIDIARSNADRFEQDFKLLVGHAIQSVYRPWVEHEAERQVDLGPAVVLMNALDEGMLAMPTADSGDYAMEYGIRTLAAIILGIEHLRLWQRVMYIATPFTVPEVERVLDLFHDFVLVRATV